MDCTLRLIADILKAVRGRALQTAKGEWIRGFKYDDTKTDEGRKLTRQELDAVSPDHPIVVADRSGHTGFVNSLALQKMDFTDRSPDPVGDQLVRNGDGRLSGVLRQAAMDRAYREGKPPTRAEKAEAVRHVTGCSPSRESLLRTTLTVLRKICCLIRTRSKRVSFAAAFTHLSFTHTSIE